MLLLQILLGLRNGMIDALPVPTFLANFNQVATYAPYMLDLNWAPITGALVSMVAGMVASTAP